MLLLLGALAPAWEMAPGVARAGDVDFGRDVLPILSENCFLCHGPDAASRKADLRLDLKEDALRVEEPVIVPGKGEESELIRRILSGDADEVMPPPKSNRTLTPRQVELLKRWVDEGAKWGMHWAFEPPRRPEPPEVRDERWPRNAIDGFVRARLDAEGLEASPEADRTTMIRRATLDLTGLPPTIEEVDAFLADRSPEAFEKVVDRLLASPRYGERMAMDWLDAARYADTNGYQNDFARSMWPWRDWVIDALNRNQPFDQFLVEQLAGDLLPGAGRAQRIATGFNRNNRTVTEAGSIDEEWRVENAVDRVETTATVFLGLTMGCARCHDHKYDPVSQKEFYEFYGFFNSINEKGVYTETRGNVPPLVALPNPDEERRGKQLDEAIAAAERSVKEQESAVAARQQTWEVEQQNGQETTEPGDWSFRSTLDGDLRIMLPGGQTSDGNYRGEGPPAWSEGPHGKALKLAGAEANFVEAGGAVRPDRTDPVSFGGWVRLHGGGAILSKMDDRASYRGFDLLVDKGKVVVHLVHSWPEDAIKVATSETLIQDTWTHVFVTYDGSGKAAGLAVSIDGRAAKREVLTDQLKGTIVTEEPLRLGKRSASLPLKGELADIRAYPRALTPDEVSRVADRPALLIARTPAKRRSESQRAFLSRFFRDRYGETLRQETDRLATLRKEKKEHEGRITTVMVMEDLPKPRETFVLSRGRYELPDKDRKVEPGVPACLPNPPEGTPRNRLGLARLLVAPDHPLTSRVTVNRIWQHHFGTGLVKTAENFGVQGEVPSHPELLDWLATEFVRTGWNVKAIHRRIVTSATYRQSSRADPSRQRLDPENRLLSRGPRYRLSAEAVRDNALAIGGLLVEKVGGPSIKPYQPAGLWEELAGGAGEAPYVQDKDENLYRRSLYIYRKRTVPHPALATFDAPSREMCQVRRSTTDTPLQSLGLLNDVTYVEAARRLGQLMLSEGGSTPEARIAYAFRRALARAPVEAELRIALRGLERHRATYQADREAAGKLVHLGESPVADGLDPGELAAYTATAGVILNLDETISLE